jgi:uncharacterized protein DUF6370
MEDSYMRKLFVVAALLCSALLLTAGITAQDKKGDGKEVTLKGKITCNKCDLGKSKACETVIVVKEGKNEVVYFFDAASHKKNHGKICTDPKQGSVTGTVKDADNKKTITVTKVTFD